jgi:putative RNA 2'-phosphotransferase
MLGCKGQRERDQTLVKPYDVTNSMRKELVRKSKLLSLVLRHNPGAIALTLDANGWASVAELLDKAASSGTVITRDELDEIVATNEKKRFDLDSVQGRIRANQGHSIDIDAEIPEAVPPAELFHGTAMKNIDSIMSQGLLKKHRQYVHLSHDSSTARAVGARHGSPVIVQVLSGDMHHDGYQFYRSKNGIWLTEEVPPRYLARI